MKYCFIDVFGNNYKYYDDYESDIFNGISRTILLLLLQSFMSFNLYNASIILFILFDLQQSRNRQRSNTIRNKVK